MYLRRLYVAALPVTIAAACAAPAPVAGTPPAPSTATMPTTGPVRWSGNLQAVQQRSGTAAPTAQNKATGTVFLAAAGPDRMRARVTVSTPLSGASGRNTGSLLWAIHPGRCGSGSLPIVGIERFPVIEVTGGGRGEVDTEIGLALPSSGEFHVNVYWGRGGTLDDVMTCANLRRDSN